MEVERANKGDEYNCGLCASEITLGRGDLARVVSPWRPREPWARMPSAPPVGLTQEGGGLGGSPLAHQHLIWKSHRGSWVALLETRGTHVALASAIQVPEELNPPLAESRHRRDHTWAGLQRLGPHPD